MNQIQLRMNPLQPVFSCGLVSPVAILSAPRELSEEEVEVVSGGIAPVVIAGAKIAGVAFATGFGTTLGIAAANALVGAVSSVWGEEEQACR